MIYFSARSVHSALSAMDWTGQRRYASIEKNLFWYIPKKVLSLSHGSITVEIDQESRLREQLIQARKSIGLTQVELAVRLGRPQSFVSKYERGERRLDIVEFCEVCRALGTDPVQFLQRFCSEES